MDKYVVISPFYNEEKGIAVFLYELEKIFAKTSYGYTVIMVDDCSIDSGFDKLKSFKFQSENYELKIIRMKYNVGHQSAIKYGLRYARNFDALGYIVIDSDGEDDPAAILTLVEKQSFDILFVSRAHRENTIAFKTGYLIYKAIFKLISNNNINFGNYSMISRKVLNSIYLQSYEHYPAFLSKLKFKKESIKFDRRRRIDGFSKMTYNDLIMHGLRSLVEYSEELLFLFIRILFFIIFIFILYGGYSIYSKFISHDAIPGWTSTIALALINSILVISGIIVLGLLILSKKNRSKSEDDIFIVYNGEK
jgi:hypothetical protein